MDRIYPIHQRNLYLVFICNLRILQAWMFKYELFCAMNWSLCIPEVGSAGKEKSKQRSDRQIKFNPKLILQ